MIGIFRTFHPFSNGHFGRKAFSSFARTQLSSVPPSRGTAALLRARCTALLPVKRSHRPPQKPLATRTSLAGLIAGFGINRVRGCGL